MPVVHVDFWESVEEEKVKIMIRYITVFRISPILQGETLYLLKTV